MPFFMACEQSNPAYANGLGANIHKPFQGITLAASISIGGRWGRKE